MLQGKEGREWEQGRKGKRAGVNHEGIGRAKALRQEGAWCVSEIAGVRVTRAECPPGREGTKKSGRWYLGGTAITSA